MMIHVIFLAQLREQLGVGTVSVSHEDVKTLKGLQEHLLLVNPSWHSAFKNKNLLVAVNHAYVKSDIELHDGDEVAFFPPVTGG